MKRERAVILPILCRDVPALTLREAASTDSASYLPSRLVFRRWGKAVRVVTAVRSKIGEVLPQVEAVLAIEDIAVDDDPSIASDGDGAVVAAEHVAVDDHVTKIVSPKSDVGIEAVGKDIAVDHHLS